MSHPPQNSTPPPDKTGQTALQRACIAGDLDAVKSLLDALDPATRHALIHRKNAFNPTALFAATKHGHAHIVADLVRRGADVTAPEDDGQTSLHAACDADDSVDTLRLLLDAVDRDKTSRIDFVNRRDRFGRTALYLACYKGHIEAAVMLLNNGADVRGAADAYGMTCLHVAAMREHRDVVELLIERVDDRPSRVELVNRVDKANRTALYFACEKGNADIAATLLRHGADADVAYEYNGFTALHAASHQGHVAVARILVESVDDDGEKRAAFVNRRCKYGHTALVYAGERGHTALAELLMQHGAVVA